AFLGNSSGLNGGGAVYATSQSSPTDIVDCMFTANHSEFLGGAVRASDMTALTNCTLYGNSAPYGGGVEGPASITNSILWHNQALHGGDVWRSEDVSISYSNVSQAGFAGVNGNISADPRFYDVDGPDDQLGTADDDLRIWTGSPCTDAANGDVATGSDIDGNPRFDDPTVDPNPGTGTPDFVDMGAYEYSPVAGVPSAEPQEVAVAEEGVLAITLTASDPDLDPLSWSVVALPENGTLTGTAPDLTYTPDPDFSGEDSLTFHVSDGTHLSNVATVKISVVAELDVWYVDGNMSVGGDGRSWATAFRHPQDGVDAAWPGDQVWVAEGTYVRRAPEDDQVIAMKKGVGLYGGFAGTETALDERAMGVHPAMLDGDSDVDGTGDTFHVVVSASDATLDAFVVQNGNANSFVEDRSNRSGAGIAAVDVRGLVISNCSLANNTASVSGGGLCTVGQCQLRAIDCVFVGNYASRNGGAASIGGEFEIESCAFFGNTADDEGGAISTWSGRGKTISNSVFSGNVGDIGGALFFHSDPSTPCLLANCSFSGNQAMGSGGGVYVHYGDAQIVNCAIWGNSAPLGPDLHENAISSPLIRHCDVGLPSYAGANGNMDVDPLFVDADGLDNVLGTPDDDLRLAPGSPCIDAGDGDFASEFDMDGDPRVDNILGDTGVGTPPWTDIGAYECQ
ncbi:MAG: Ig-like domain-containing protein, partial [Planctomycetota bacterium]